MRLIADDEGDVDEDAIADDSDAAMLDDMLDIENRRVCCLRCLDDVLLQDMDDTVRVSSRVVEVGFGVAVDDGSSNSLSDVSSKSSLSGLSSMVQRQGLSPSSASS